MTPRICLVEFAKWMFVILASLNLRPCSANELSLEDFEVIGSDGFVSAGYPLPIACCLSSPKVYLPGNRGTIKCVEMPTGKILSVIHIPKHLKSVSKMAISSDEKHLAISAEGRLLIVATDSGKVIYDGEDEISCTSDRCDSFAFGPNDSMFHCFDANTYGIVVVNISARTVHRRIETPEFAQIMSYAIMPDMSCIAVYHDAKKTYLREWSANGKTFTDKELDLGDRLVTYSISPSGRWIAGIEGVGEHDDVSVHIFDRRTSRIVAKRKYSIDKLSRERDIQLPSVTFSEDDHLVAIAKPGRTGGLDVIDLVNSSPIRSIATTNPLTASVSQFCNRSKLLCYRTESRLHVYKLKSDELVAVHTGMEAISAVEFLGIGEHLLITSTDGIHVYDVALKQWRWHHPRYAMAIGWNDHVLGIAGRDSCELIDMTTGEVARRFVVKPPKDAIPEGVITQFGVFLRKPEIHFIHGDPKSNSIVMDWDHECIAHWNLKENVSTLVKSHGVLGTIHRFNESPFIIGFEDENSRFQILENDRVIYKTDQDTHFTACCSARSRSLAFVLYSCNKDTKQQIDVFDWKRNSMVTSFELDPPIPSQGPLGVPNPVAVSPDGKWIVVGGCEGSVGMYCVDNNAKRAIAKTPVEQAITCLSFSPDGKKLAIGYLNGTIAIGTLKLLENVTQD